MIKSHEKKTEIKKKTNVTGEYGAIDGDEDEDQEEADCSLPSNTNAQNAAAVEKARRDKIAQVMIDSFLKELNYIKLTREKCIE
jgi:hypothetical protein